MIIKQLHALGFDNNDVYRLEVYQDKIIINEDYHGIRVLDHLLNTLRIIPIIEGLIVDFIYKKFDGNEILLCDLEHNRLVHVDMKFFTHSIIEIDDFLDRFSFTRNYYWDDNIFILASEYEDDFYQIIFNPFSLQKIFLKAARSLMPTFIRFAVGCRSKNAITIYPREQIFIFKKNRNFIGLYDFRSNGLIFVKHKLDNFEEVSYHAKYGFIFFYVWEKNIVFQKYKIFLKSSDPDYYLLGMGFLERDQFVLLETNKDDHKQCRLGIYGFVDV